MVREPFATYFPDSGRPVRAYHVHLAGTSMKAQIEWLTQRVDSAPTSYGLSRSEMSALRIRMEWQKLKRKARDGDEIWAFTNPTNAWKRYGKHTGYALVRDGAILESVVVSRD
jgi:hypothetical protein